MDLTRVGMPVAPPIYLPLTVRILCMNDQGRAEQLVENSDGAHMFLTRDSQLLVLTEDFVAHLKSKLSIAKQNLESRIAVLNGHHADEKSIAKLRRWIEQLKELETDYDALLNLRLPIAIPESEESVQIKQSPLCVSRKVASK